MKIRFQELDYQQTPLGELILRVRGSASVPDTPVYEVKLNGEFLMSSLVNQSEKALATLAIEALGERPCDVLVGGLGLGYTAAAALAFDQVRRVRVIEYLRPVIEWQRRRLVPAAATLMDDPRCEPVHADFFKYVADAPASPQDRHDAILLDIDHSPESLLHPRHHRLYTEEGLSRLAKHLRPGGVFALWSAQPPEPAFLDALRAAFPTVRSHAISFYNPLLHEQEENTIVLAQSPPGGRPR